jgi:phosphotransferase system  glucose/maltose/N-acetylglucosamine-specific IIC component
VCFSAEVDLVAGLGIGVVGVDALRHVRGRGQLPLACLPVLLGTHQLLESAVWAGLGGDLSDRLWRAALWSYLAIAFGILPILVPVAVARLDGGDRRRLLPFVVTGAGVAIVLMAAVVRGPVEAWSEGRHIVYSVDLDHGGVLVGLYVVATCGGLLASRRDVVRWFGYGNLLVVGALALVAQTALVSLWCAWAAVTSVAIAAHLRGTHASPQLLRA